MIGDLRSVEVDGLDARLPGARVWGPPVLLIHGWPTSSFLWRNVMPAIAEHNRVVAIDLPGYGGCEQAGGAEPLRLRSLRPHAHRLHGRAAN